MTFFQTRTRYLKRHDQNHASLRKKKELVEIAITEVKERLASVFCIVYLLYNLLRCLSVASFLLSF